MRNKILLLGVGILSVINFAYSLENDYYAQIPSEPAFPVISPKIKMIGQDFLGIISDIESDIIVNPSLLSLLKYNEVNVSFLPYIKDKIRNPVSLSFLYPKLFSSRVGLGFQNQYVYSSKATNYVINDMNVNKHYKFWSYQNLFFISFSATPNLNISPFYTITKSPYRNENEYYLPIEAWDSSYTYYSILQLNSDYHSQQFGLGINYNWERNSLQFVGSLQKGNNKDNGNGQYSSWSKHDYLHSDTVGNSYHYYLYKSIYFNKDTIINQGSEQNYMTRLSCRWCKELNNNEIISSLIDFRHVYEEPTGMNFDSRLYTHIDSNYYIWRNYPYSESTRTTFDSTQDNYTYYTNTSGKHTKINLTIGFGYEEQTTKFSHTFVGLKLTAIFDVDSVMQENLNVNATDSTSDTTISYRYPVKRNKKIIASIPVGWENSKLSPVLFRWGVNPKMNIEWNNTRWEFDTLYYSSYKEYLSCNYSVGIGLNLFKNLFIDIYNTGNLFSTYYIFQPEECALQVKYKF